MDEILRVIIFRRLERRKRGRRNLFWIHPIRNRKLVFGCFSHLDDAKKFYNFFRMGPDLFFLLSNILGERIRKQNTNYRAAISPE